MRLFGIVTMLRLNSFPFDVARLHRLQGFERFWQGYKQETPMCRAFPTFLVTCNLDCKTFSKRMNRYNGFPTEPIVPCFILAVGRLRGGNPNSGTGDAVVKEPDAPPISL